jgi:nucleoside-diphosphate-sugar epimerase
VNPIFVTGAQGFAGRAFVAHALNCGEHVVGFGRSQRDDAYFTHRISLANRSVRAPVPTEIRSSLSSSMYEYRCGNILDVETLTSILRETKPRAIVHLASGLRGDDLESLVRTNVIGTMTLFDAISHSRIPLECILLASTGGVYGQPVTLPIGEESSCEPIDLYATTKLAAERVGVIRSKGSRVIRARIFNLIGPGQDERHVCGRFAAQAVALIAEPRKVLRVGNLCPTRDFVDVRDAATALMMLLQFGNDGVYNISSGIETHIEAILSMTLGCVGLKDEVSVEQTHERDADICRHFGSNGKLRALGWVPHYEIHQSIEDLVTYYCSLASRV